MSSSRSVILEIRIACLSFDTGHPTAFLKVNKHVDNVPSFLQVCHTTFLTKATHVLNDSVLTGIHPVEHTEFHRLNSHVLIVIPADLHLHWVLRGGCRG
jgi:hypothetical protein